MWDYGTQSVFTLSSCFLVQPFKMFFTHSLLPRPSLSYHPYHGLVTYYLSPSCFNSFTLAQNLCWLLQILIPLNSSLPSYTNSPSNQSIVASVFASLYCLFASSVPVSNNLVCINFFLLTALFAFSPHHLDPLPSLLLFLTILHSIPVAQTTPCFSSFQAASTSSPDMYPFADIPQLLTDYACIIETPYTSKLLHAHMQTYMLHNYLQRYSRFRPTQHTSFFDSCLAIILIAVVHNLLYILVYTRFCRV